MMIYTLCINLKNTEGALERILGKLRQRSFSLCSMIARPASQGGSMVALITVKSNRSPELALKQINKLYDVQTVELSREVEEVKESEFFRTAQSVEVSLPV